MNMSENQKAGIYRASYTVEAAILMAIIVTVLAALMITAFYLHDCAVLQAESCEIVSAGSNAVTEKEQQKVTAELKKMITKDRLLGSQNISGQVNTGKNGVSAAWEGKYPVPGIVGKFILHGTLPVKASWNSEKIKPADTIRKFRGVKKLLSGGEN